MSVDLRLGRWQDVLADVERVDALITDPPYSERTHSGHDGFRASDDSTRRRIDYGFWTHYEASAFCKAWTARVFGWIVILTDHILAPVIADTLSCGRYVFAPIPFVAPGSRVRLAGDGPSSWTCWIVVARPRHEPYSNWGTLQGAYVLPPGENRDSAGLFAGYAVTGGKPLWLMRALVRDYSRPGDLIVDPCAGGATTLLAAAMEGRRAIGAEMDPDTYAKAQKRLAGGWTPPLFAEPVPEPQPVDLFGEPA